MIPTPQESPLRFFGRSNYQPRILLTKPFILPDAALILVAMAAADQLKSIFAPKVAEKVHKGEGSKDDLPSLIVLKGRRCPSCCVKTRYTRPAILSPYGNVLIKKAFINHQFPLSFFFSTVDKLEQTKIRERDIKEAHHRELAAVKNSGAERQREEQQLLKEERILHDTKRAAKDKRDAVKHAKREEAGQTCEHNVYKCKICFPHKVGKPMPA